MLRHALTLQSQSFVIYEVNPIETVDVLPRKPNRPKPKPFYLQYVLKDPGAARLGTAGGVARAKALSANRRKEIASNAANARWGK